MIKFILAFFLFLFSCGKKDDLVDIESFINQGKKINLIDRKNLNSQEIIKIKSLEKSNYAIYKNWSESGQNSKNYIKPTKVFFEKKNRQISKKFNKFIIYNNNIITINSKSNIIIYSLDFKKINSKKIYKRKIYKNYNVNFSIIAYKNNLYISDNLGNVHSFKIKNLELNWKKNFGVPFRSNLKIYENNLFIINSNSKIFSININNNIFFTNDSSEVYCLDLVAKNIKWSLIFDNENFENLPLISSSSPITIDDSGILYISNNNGNTYSIDSNTGLLRWSAPIYSTNRFVVSKNYLFSVFENYIFIINKNNGKILFNKKISLTKKNKKLLFKDVLINQKNVYLFDINGYLVTINKSDLTKYKVNKFFKKYSDLIIINNSLYVNTGDAIYEY